jgi:DNA-binding transcriptional ArsR family regulator
LPNVAGVKATVFDALADPVRRSLLEQLRTDGPSSLGALAEGRSITRQGVTKHLDVLAAAGLITVTRRGRERIHDVDPEPLRQLADFLAPYAAAWDDRFGRLTRHLEENP